MVCDIETPPPPPYSPVSPPTPVAQDPSDEDRQPRRRRIRLRSPISHNSPLLRAYSPDKAPSFKRRPLVASERLQSRHAYQRRFIRRDPQHTQGRPHPYSRPGRRWQIRQEVLRRHEVSKGPLIDSSKIPTPDTRDDSIRTPALERFRQTLYTNRTTNHIIGVARKNMAIKDKTLPYDEVKAAYPTLSKFLSSDENYVHWKTMRVGTVLNGGLRVQVHALDEVLAWCKICLLETGELPSDILLDTSEMLCNALIGNLVHAVQCTEGGTVVESSLKFAFENLVPRGQYIKALLTLKRVYSSEPLMLLAKYAVLVPTFRTQQVREPLYSEIRNCMTSYCPGDCFALLKTGIEKHVCDNQCSASCKVLLPAIIGPQDKTSGIFFVCK
ncbi:hypothetical protein RHVP.57 [Cricetid gammaherpesvirus 2]|uniref:Multifunctional expression regulator n=1 Tax=Cricetid gammaherpesvirus 2 TaxID=1605972 RepID=E9M5P0_9GAMA|nr:hypothetical protein RHVP.57 [Cricetid gammaherpesvirus 2]ADW24398.1 hypothetical protein RHVP.57 [Cricetid gammaherpesvirus 2]ADW24480.1 hypothetical protein RHVP-L.57 [Cricetid gammaherpesvirus 2]